jgi:ribosomal protein L40E
MSGVLFLSFKKCLSCNAQSPENHKSCSGCGHLFLREASDEEIRIANKAYKKASEAVQ